MPEGKLIATLRIFSERQIDYIIVGGVAAVLNGAPVNTFDIDLVYSTSAANIERLLAVLADLEAVYRFQAERRLRPNKSHLTGGGHLNLLTRLGPLDLLGWIGQNLTFDDLLPLSKEMDIAVDLRVRVLGLETIISVKEHLASEKDLAVLPILRRTLQEIKGNRERN